VNKGIYRITLCISLALLWCGYIHATDICIAEISISGNKKTKDFIILRELPFQEGDIFPEEELQKHLEVSINHLNNTSLFNFVYIDYELDSVARADCKTCTVSIRVEERWYYWPEIRIKFEDRNLSSWLQEKDYKRITIGLGISVDNVFGLMHSLSANYYFGYKKGFRMSYSNIALNKKHTQMLGFSMVSLYNKTMNLFSENDRVVYVKDPDHYLDKTFEGAINYTYRPDIRNSHTINVGFQQTKLLDTVLTINKHYWGSNKLVNSFYTIAYNYGHEHRNSVSYPTTGFYAGTEMKGVTADNLNFFYGSLNLKLQYYYEFFHRWFWSSRLNASATFKNKRAYIFDQNVGYEEKNITGFDYYVVDGQHFTILSNDIRYCLLPTRTVYLSSSEKALKFMKIPFAIYAKLSFDGGYVYDKHHQATNTLANTFLWGTGLGIDLATYYDIVLNCNYSINKKGERAFFVGIKAPIF